MWFILNNLQESVDIKTFYWLLIIVGVTLYWLSIIVDSSVCPSLEDLIHICRFRLRTSSTIYWEAFCGMTFVIYAV